MRHRLTLTLLTIVALLLSLVVIFEPGREQPPAEVALTPIAVAQLERLTIRRPGAPALALERRANHWWLTAPWPVPVPALAYRIESTLGLLAARREHSQGIADLDLAQFELDTPLLELEAGGEHLLFGNTHPIKRERHVRRGDELHRIADFHFAAIDVDATEWVATAPVPPDVSLRRIELPGRVLQLERPAAGAADAAAPAASWGGPQGEAELPASEVASAWREARAWRIERLEDLGPPTGANAEASAHSAATPGAEAAARTDAAGGGPGLGALDPLTAGGEPARGALDPAGIRIGWEGGHIDFRIVRREPELILARDEVGLAWVFEGPDVRRLLGLAAADDPAAAGGEAKAETTPEGTPGP